MNVSPLKIHQAPVYVFFQVLLEVLFSDIVWGVVIAFSHFEDRLPVFENFTFSEGVFLLFLVFQITAMSYIFLTWIRNYYWFEENTLFHHRGILFSRVDELLLTALDTVEMKQGILGKIFDYGHIKLVFPHKTIVLKYFPHPAGFLEIIQKCRKVPYSSLNLHDALLA